MRYLKISGQRGPQPSRNTIAGTVRAEVRAQRGTGAETIQRRRNTATIAACATYATLAAHIATTALVMALFAHPAFAQSGATPPSHTAANTAPLRTIDIVGTGSTASPGTGASSTGATVPPTSARTTRGTTPASAPAGSAGGASGSLANASTRGAAGARLRVIVPTAFAYAVHDIANTFTAHTGMPVTVHVTTAGNAAGSLRERGTEGATSNQPFDIVIATQADITQMAGQGLLAAQTSIALPKVGIGLAVPTGRAIPDIGTVDALRRTLLSAHTVVFEDPALGGPSGANVVKLFDRLGLADRMKSRSKMVPAEDIRHALTHSHADLVIEESRLLRDAPGVQYVGPLPASVQYFTRYAGAITARSTHPTAARALLSFIASGLSPQVQVDP